MYSIYDAYDQSVQLTKRGELLEAAIFHALQRELRPHYPHDAQAMLLHWHQRNVELFGK